MYTIPTTAHSKPPAELNYFFKFHRSHAHGVPYSIWCEVLSLSLMEQYLEVMPATWGK